MRKRVNECLKKINADNSNTWHNGAWCDTIVTDRLACGTENVVKELVFEDNQVWSIRHSIISGPPKVIDSEVITTRYIKANTTIPIPEIYDFDSSSNNVLSCQYIFMEGLRGRTRGNRPCPVLLDVPTTRKAKYVCNSPIFSAN